MSDSGQMIAEIMNCRPDELPPESTPLRKIEGWDSLKHVLLIVSLENRLNTKLTAEEIQGIVTIADVTRVTMEKGAHV